MSMTVDQAIGRAFVHAQRKATPPATGTSKYNALLAIADSMQKLWASEPGVEWNSLYSNVMLTAIVSATDTFSLANASGSIKDISKRVGNYVLVTNGTNSCRYTVVAPEQLYEKRYVNAVARIGNNLKFSKAFDASSPYIGFNIQVPAIMEVADITAGANTVAVDDPMWLVYSMAAEYCRNDTVRQGQYDNLLQLADQHMQRMKTANSPQLMTVAMPWAPDGESWI